MADALKNMQEQLHVNMERRMQKVLTAHMEQVGAEIRLAIATQGQGLIQLVESKLDAFKSATTAQVNQVKSAAEPVSDQGDDDVDDDDDDDDEEEVSSSSSSSSQEEKQTSNQDTPVVIDSSTLELLQMLRAAQAITQPRKPDRQALEKVSRAVQRKVAARANARARNLTDKKKRVSSQKPKETAVSAHQKLLFQAKLTAEARKTKKKKADDALIKKKAEDAFKLAELLLKQML
ncbi:hypothetical protein PHYBOEH_006902 [Phytophthora boehmeriae]|uniref:Uncharacterized protein n=1 Tax=Phytophthora boehmeriae TaxID=109152 RepID=A0A8T1WET8_9STRA|nr:hypothetical protein PHYBOEH_006902 [Phytophthora boehmeriae]